MPLKSGFQVWINGHYFGTHPGFTAQEAEQHAKAEWQAMSCVRINHVQSTKAPL